MSSNYSEFPLGKVIHDIVAGLSGTRGYSYSRLDYIKKRLCLALSKKNISKGHFYRLLRCCEICGYIKRERFGNRVFLWTSENWKNREQILRENPYQDIGTKSLKKILSFTDPEYAAKMRSSFVSKEVIFFRKNETENETENETDFALSELPRENLGGNDIMIEIDNSVVKMERPKKPVFPTKSPPLLSNKKSTSKNFAKHPKASVIEIEKANTLSEHQLSLLYARAPKDIVDKKLENARRIISLMVKDNNTHSEKFKKGVYGLAMDYLEEWISKQAQRKAQRDQKALEEKERRETPEEARITFARELLNEFPKFAKYFKIFCNSIVIRLELVDEIRDRLPFLEMTEYQRDFEQKMRDMIRLLEDFEAGRCIQAKKQCMQSAKIETKEQIPASLMDPKTGRWYMRGTIPYERLYALGIRR